MNEPHGRGTTFAARAWRNTFSSLDSRDYRYFWLSTLAWFFGIQMQVFARGWLVYDMTRSPLAIGWVSFAFGLPLFVLSPLSGAITDRADKRNLLVMTQIMAGAVNLFVAILIFMGAIQVWHITVSAFLTGVVVSFNMPGRQSVIPQLVKREQLLNAVALSSGAMNLTRIAGPSLAGILVVIIGVDWVFLMTVVCFAIGAALCLMMSPMTGTGSHAGSSMKSEVWDGFRYVRGNPTLVALLTLAFVPVILGMPYQTLMPAFAVDVLHVGAEGLGLLMTAVGAGALVGSVAVASLGNIKYKGLLLFGALAVFGIFLVLFSQSNSFPLALFSLVVIGITSNLYGSSNNTLIQIHADENMRGRVMGIYMITVSLMPLSVLPMSAAAETIGIQPAIAIGGAGLILFTIMIALLRPDMRRL